MQIHIFTNTMFYKTIYDLGKGNKMVKITYVIIECYFKKKFPIIP